MISLCDESGIMCEPWAEAGYTCYAVDLQHAVRSDRVKNFEGGGKIVFQFGDARFWTPPEGCRIIFVACFPVCTNIAVSGARDFEKKGLPLMCDGLLLFNSCYQVASWSGAPFCVENPVGIIPTHFRKPDHYFHPWFYGDNYTKKTCLWTGNGFKMPEAQYISQPDGCTQKIWLMSPGADRQRQRSETPKGFAISIFNSNRP